MVEQLPVCKVEVLDYQVNVDVEVVPVGAFVDLALQDGLPHAPRFENGTMGLDSPSLVF